LLAPERSTHLAVKELLGVLRTKHDAIRHC
jgi:hypothetical protein